ncbi:MAG TPA: GNAT family N-acetyltransferase [Pyrinomonadaceae bacterium]|jgi:ribosomal protein S18 acetylase RimI-like enzyme
MNKSNECEIRPLTQSDQPFLWEMLYQSLYVPEDRAPFERSILDHPDIARYVNDWGRENDSGFVALDENNRPIGAIWLRLLTGKDKGFGYVDDKTPELGMAVLAEYRGQGIGTRLLSRLVESAGDFHEHISLSVARGNPALHLYQRLGFEIVGEHGNSITMKRKLNAHEEAQHNAGDNPR